MRNTTRSARRSFQRYAFLAAVVLPAGGCVTTTSGSGDTTPVSFTTEGTEAVVPRPIKTVATHTQEVLAKNGIKIDESKTGKGGDVQEYKGTANGLDVTVFLQRQAPEVTKVEVTAKKNLVEFNKDFAKKINEQIIAKST